MYTIRTDTKTPDLPTSTADDALSTIPGGKKGISGRPSPADVIKKPGEDDEKSSLKIHIQLDLDVEVHLTARVKGDIIIGLL